MKKYIVVVFICICSLSSFPQTENYTFSSNVINRNIFSQYGFIGNSVYKADSLGNSIWVKDFSGKISSQLADSNHVACVYESGDKIFVCLSQSEILISASRLVYCITVLDTNGNVMSMKYSDVTSPTSVSLSGLGTVDTGFVWFIGNYSTGNSSHIELIQMDSLVGVSQSIEIWNNSSTYLLASKILPDSSVLVYTGTTGAFNPPEFQITVIDHSTFPTIHKNIISNYIWPPNIGSAAKGPSGELVAFFSDNSSPVSTTVLKLNAQGNLVACRTWPSTTIGPSGRISFQNSSFNYDDGINSFNFDSLLIDSCLGAGITLNFTMNNFQLYSSVFDFSNPSGFAPITSPAIATFPIQIYNPPINNSPDYCLFLSSNESTFNNESISIWPNPSIDKLNLEFSTVKKYIDKNLNYSITDMNGRYMNSGEILIDAINSQKAEIDISNLLDGIYFLKLESAESVFVKRVVKSDIDVR